MSFKLRIAAGLLLLAVGCSKSPVPSGVFLSLSVSTGDVAVETRINGKANDYLSGRSGGIVASGPINASLKDGANEISFILSRGEDADDAFEPWFLAALEVGIKGETIDTTMPGKRLVFERELTESEIQTLLGGDEVVLTETFDVSRDDLKEAKSTAEMAPKLEPAPSTGH